MKADKSNFYGYNKTLKDLAKANRRTMTKAEVCLWKYVLKARKMKGYLFRRQRPVLNYIADFMCPELMLIIEVDGITHHFDDVQINDRLKERELKKAGFSVLRFDDEDILENINWVVAEIEEWIEKSPNRPPP